MQAIKTEGLTRYYDDFPAAVDISLSVPRGSLYGLIGPNGAGKTTIIKMLTCLLSPTAGSASVMGFDVEHDPQKAKESLGYLGEFSYLYEDMVVGAYLRFFAAIYRLPKKRVDERIHELLASLGIEDRRDSVIGDLSKGLKRRVAVARTLIHDPPLLILDEVTSGLDPITARELRDYLFALKGQGKTIFFSTHNLYEAELLCDHVSILDHGRVLAQGSVAQLIDRYAIAGKGGREAALEKVFFAALADEKHT